MKAIIYNGKYVEKVDNGVIRVSDNVVKLLDDTCKRYKRKLDKMWVKYEIVNL